MRRPALAAVSYATTCSQSSVKIELGKKGLDTRGAAASEEEMPRSLARSPPEDRRLLSERIYVSSLSAVCHRGWSKHGRTRPNVFSRGVKSVITTLGNTVNIGYSVSLRTGKKLTL